MAHKILSVKQNKFLPCPGSKIRSKGKGRGKGYGKGHGPIGIPYKQKQEQYYGRKTYKKSQII